MTSMLAVKARRDLRATWPRTVLMVIAIAISLSVFGGVLFAWSAVDRETERAYLSSEPASATIQFGPGLEADEMATVAAAARTRPGVLGAAGRTQFTSEIQVNGQPRRLSLQVFAAAPDDPLALANFQVRQGGWPPAPGDILIRADSLAPLDVAVGDTVTLTRPDGGTARLRVAGTVYDPSLAPAGQLQIGQGYLSTASLAALGEPDVFDQLKIQVADPGRTAPSRNRDRIVSVASEVATWLQNDRGLVIREVQVPPPYAHPHQGEADAVLAALLVGAGVTLVLSTILVATMLNALFTQQIPQIGIMKAIGAGAGRLGRHYLGVVLSMAAAATVIALPLAVMVSRGLGANALQFLGVRSGTLAAAWWTYLVVLGTGLVLPVLMALVPLVKASRTTVRAAIDHRGVRGSTRAGTGLLTRLARVRGVNRSLLLAARNTVRRPARSALSLGLLAAAGMIFVGAMSASDGTAAVVGQEADQIRWDVVVQLGSAVSTNALVPVVQQVPGVTRAEGWRASTVGISGPGGLPLSRSYPDRAHGGVIVSAVPGDTRMLRTPTLREGRWLKPNETGAVVLSQIALLNTGYHVHPGDTVELYVDGRSTTWRLVGITEERGEIGSAYVTEQDLARATKRPLWVNTLRISTDRHDEKTRQAIADAVNRKLTDAGVDVRSSDSVGREETSVGGHIGPIVAILLATALPTALIGLIGLALTMTVSILEGTREFGVMYAIGARRRSVRGVVVAEGVLIAVASCLLAVIPTLLFTVALGTLLGDLLFHAPLPLRISWGAAGVWALLVILGGALAARAAATRVSRLTVRDALTYL